MLHWVFAQATGLSPDLQLAVVLGPSEPYWQFFYGTFYAVDVMIAFIVAWIAWTWFKGFWQ